MKINYIPISILVVFFSLIIVCIGSEVDVKYKATIEYGDNSDQIGMQWKGEDSFYNEGPRGIIIDKDDNIIIGDYVSGNVKVFDNSGQFILETEDKIGNMQSFTVSDDGSIFVRDENDRSDIVKFNKYGIKLWRKSFKDVVNIDQIKTAEEEFHINISKNFAGFITSNNDGSIIVELNAYTQTQSNKDQISVGMHLTEDGDFIEIIPYYLKQNSDRWITFNEKLLNDSIFLEALVTKNIEKIDKHIILDTNADNGIHFYRIKYGISGILSDNNDGFWVISHIKSDQMYYIKPGIQINLDMVLNHFDADGNFLEEWRFPAGPINIGLSDITVAPNGDVYHLQFHEQGVNVVAYRSSAYNSSSSGNASSLYGLSSRNIDGVLYTHLRSLASESGYKVYWDKETKTTIISNREKKISISNRTAVVRTEELEKRDAINTLMLNGSYWVSAEDAASVLSMPVQTDKTNRVAYLIK